MKASLPYKVIASALLVAFLVQLFTKPFIVADYYVNTAGYAKNCVNKMIPLMHCNGKCQLMKKLGQQESHDQDKPDRREQKTDSPLSLRSFFANSIPVQEGPDLKRQYGYFQDARLFAHSKAIFHPPPFATV